MEECFILSSTNPNFIGANGHQYVMTISKLVIVHEKGGSLVQLFNECLYRAISNLNAMTASECHCVTCLNNDKEGLVI